MRTSSGEALSDRKWILSFCYKESAIATLKGSFFEILYDYNTVYRTCFVV